MNILQIIPGSGGSFYCGNCLRDSKFYEAIKLSGHEAVKVPMYLPLFSDERDLKEIPIFYGAISIYLKQLYPIFRKAPAWFDRLLNSKPMLKFAASKAGSTNAKGLEEMTLSMLLGEEGQQKEELNRMVDWMAENLTPDIIHLSNALLLGLAPKLKEKFPNVPLVCSLQDEDVWVDVMHPNFRDKVWNLMGQQAKFVDAFIAVSEFYAKVSKKKMNLSDENLFITYLGVDPDDYLFAMPSSKERTVGYISRMCEENGFDILLDAFILLKQDVSFADVRLVLTGGSTGDDKQIMHEAKRKIAANKLEKDVEFHADFEGEGRQLFFNKVSAISVPVRNGEAFGMYLLEAMASGVPVVQPDLGAFQEIIDKTGGGIIYKENTPQELAKALKQLLNDDVLMDKLAKKGRESATHGFNIHTQVRDLIKIYESLKS